MNSLNLKPSLKDSASLCLSLSLLCSIILTPASLADEVSVKETSVTTTAPVNTASTVTVEHTKSVMEPAVVQETVGASGTKMVQPLIMERKDKLLDRTTYTTKPTGAVTTTTTVVKDSPVDPPQVIQKAVAP